jgi:hypothetical protein
MQTQEVGQVVAILLGVQCPAEVAVFLEIRISKHGS